MLFPNEKYKNNDDYKRIIVDYKNSNKFACEDICNANQYAVVYSARLTAMRELLIPKIKEKWGDTYPIKRMYELREEDQEKCVIIGTLFKNQKYKPSILRDISEETQLAPQPPRYNYTDDSDLLILEDELQRIRIIGNIDVNYLVTGIVCAVLGYEDGNGKFIVDECLYYECGPQKPLKDLKESPLLLLISGLDQVSDIDCTMSIELLQQWIYGNIDRNINEKDFEVANVARIIIAGDAICSTAPYKQKANFTRPAQSKNTLLAVKSVDDIISKWVQSVPVDLMPGEFDPSNYMLPQQPMHQCMFPLSAKSKNFTAVTNPYQFEIYDRVILGTAGQSISDIERNSKFENPLDILRSIIKWGHIAPTSPDTLPCFPYYSIDPFIISNCPHILFTGNSTKFLTELYIGHNNNKTRLICVPSFSKTQCAVIVNLRTLDCKLLNFHIDDFDDTNGTMISS